jgi:hypothetical protein
VYPAVLAPLSHPLRRVLDMSSDNPSGAVNQQERPSSAEWLDALPADLGNWVAGFVDGEGSFNVPIRRLRSGPMPYREVTALIQLGRHLSPDGFEEILCMRAPMNRGGKRRRSDEQLIADLRTWNPQRPYARLPLEAEG